MTHFVLDASVAMRWHLETDKKVDQRYAEAVLMSLREADALVPHLWHIEATNVLLVAERTKQTSAGEVESFIAQLENLPIHIDPMTARQAFNRTFALGRVYKLSGYDAAYLELAIREGLPIATLDADLEKAAKKAGVQIYLK